MSESQRKKGRHLVQRQVTRNGKTFMQGFWVADPNEKSQSAQLADKHVKSMQKRRRMEEQENSLKSTRKQRELFDDYHEPAMLKKAATNRVEKLKQMFTDGLVVDEFGESVNEFSGQEFNVPGIGVIKPKFDRTKVSKQFDPDLAYKNMTDEQLAQLPKGALKGNLLRELDPETYLKYTEDDYESPTISVIGDVDAAEEEEFGSLPKDKITLDNFVNEFARAKWVERENDAKMGVVRERMEAASVFEDQLRGAQDGEETDGVTISYRGTTDWDAIVRDGVFSEKDLDRFRDTKLKKGDIDRVFGKKFGEQFQVQKVKVQALINLPKE